MTASIDRPGLCEDCGAARLPGQRYCLHCGARIGSRSSQLEWLLGDLRERSRRERAALAGVATGAPATGLAPVAGRRGARGPARALATLRLPSSRVSAALVLMFLGFGVIVGGVAGSPVQDTLAASAGRQVKLILPVAVPASSSTGSSAPSSASSASEPPPAEAEPTPAAASEPSGAGGAGASTGKSGAGKPAAGGSSSPSSSGGKGGGGSGSSVPAGGSSNKLPPIKHVFVIMLSDQPYAAVFGPSSPSPYLSQTLERRGELLVRYYAVAHQQLANGIGLLSGQGPTPETAANCATYGDLAPATVGADEQMIGNGCVYPSATQTLPGQLTAKHLSWRAYVQGMDEPGFSAGACAHPELGASDPTTGQTPPGQPYATFRNPLVYFHSIIDSSACADDDVGLDKLAMDLANPKTTPSFSYIVPDSCHDASPTPCASGAPAGLPAAEDFLHQVVAEITSAKAYKESGLLVITVDEAPSSGEYADSSSCCGQPQFPNMPASSSALGPEGGGQVGALLLSPFIKQGVSQEPYNHFSLLHTVEDIFGLSHLGYAGLPKVGAFEASIFSQSK